jgi:ankyrin repeat protein
MLRSIVGWAALVAFRSSLFTTAGAALSTVTMDPDGFDAVADTVGAGIYSGRVLRDAEGRIVIGKQYQNHNKNPGPVYSGGGYTDMANAIHKGPEAVKALLAAGADPNEIMTGGARPLHTCGMSRSGELSTAIIIAAGGGIEALDTYGYTPLHRMASNNLAIGAQALLEAGADVNRPTEKPYAGDTPLRIAMQSGAKDVAAVLRKWGGKA